MDSKLKKEFVKELHNLLNKYDAQVSFHCNGDTYGINGESIKFIHKPTGKVFCEDDGYYYN